MSCGAFVRLGGVLEFKLAGSWRRDSIWRRDMEGAPSTFSRLDGRGCSQLLDFPHLLLPRARHSRCRSEGKSLASAAKAHLNGVQGAAGSNPAVPTRGKRKPGKRLAYWDFLRWRRGDLLAAGTSHTPKPRSRYGVAIRCACHPVWVSSAPN